MACKQARADERICRKCFDVLGDAIKAAEAVGGCDAVSNDWRVGLSVQPKYRGDPLHYVGGVVLEVFPPGTAGIIDETGVLKIRLASGTVILRGADEWVTA